MLFICFTKSVFKSKAGYYCMDSVQCHINEDYSELKMASAALGQRKNA